MTDDVAAAGSIVKHPVRKTRTIQTIWTVSTAAGAAGRRDLHGSAPTGIPAEYQRFAAPEIIHLANQRERVFNDGSAFG